LSLRLLRQKFSPDELALLRRGSRLSVMPVAAEVAQRIIALRG